MRNVICGHFVCVILKTAVYKEATFVTLVASSIDGKNNHTKINSSLYRYIESKKNTNLLQVCKSIGNGEYEINVCGHCFNYYLNHYNSSFEVNIYFLGIKISSND